MIPLNKKTYLSLVVGLVFSVVALYFTFVNVPMRELADYLKRINYWWLIPSLLLAAASYVVRIWRWQIILRPVKKTGFWNAFHPLMIGFMMSCVFPGRVGEIARPIIYYKREKVEFSKALGTVGIERVFDALSLIVFFIYILAKIDIDPSLNIDFAGYHLTPALLEGLWKTTLYLSFVLIGGIVMISFSVTRNAISRMVLKSPDVLFFTHQTFRQKLKNGICTKITEILGHFAVGFDIIKSPVNLIICMALSLFLWWLLGWAFYVMTFGAPGIEITFLEAFAVEIIICFFIMLPSVPGYWGLWEAGGVFGLMIFGIPAKEAAGLTLTYHFFHLIPVILVGIASAMLIGVKLVRPNPQDPESMKID